MYLKAWWNMAVCSCKECQLGCTELWDAVLRVSLSQLQSSAPLVLNFLAHVSCSIAFNSTPFESHCAQCTLCTHMVSLFEGPSMEVGRAQFCCSFAGLFRLCMLDDPYVSMMVACIEANSGTGAAGPAPCFCKGGAHYAHTCDCGDRRRAAHAGRPGSPPGPVMAHLEHASGRLASGRHVSYVKRACHASSR